jgi:hypothetical protein
MQVVVICSVVLLTARVQATVTNIVWYRMGENDPGASPGAAVAHTGSSLSVNLQTGVFATNTIVSTLVTNFGMEAWVKPSSSAGLQVLMYNGSTATSGWGIIISAANYMGLFGGKVGFGTAPVVPNVWTHVALVRDGTVSTL